MVSMCCCAWLQTVDRFNNLFVTAYVTPGSARLLLLHDGKADDSIRTFFSEVHELYLRVRWQQRVMAAPACRWLLCGAWLHAPGCRASSRCRTLHASPAR